MCIRDRYLYYDEYDDSDEEIELPQNSEDVVDRVDFFSDTHKEKKLKKIRCV